MQQFIQKEIEFSDRNQALNDDPTQEQESANKELGPCKFKDLLRFSDRIDKVLMLLGSIFSITNGLSIIFYAAPLKDLIDAFNPAANMENLISNIGHAAYGFFLNGLLVFFSCCFMTITWTVSSQRQLVRIRKIYYQSLLRQQLLWYDKNRPQQICSDMYVQTQRAQNTLVESVTSMLTCLSMGIGSLVVSFAKGWKLALVLNAYIPVVVILNYMRSQINLRCKTATADLNAKLNGDVFEVFENIKTVKYLGGEEYELSRYNKELSDFREKTIKLQRKMSIVWSITAFCSYASVFALGFWYGCKLVVEQAYNSNTGQNYNVGDVVAVFFCMYICAANLNPMAGHFANLNGCRVAFSKIIQIVDRKPKKSQGFQQCIRNIEEIEFKNMSFCFNQPLFNGFNLTLKRGIIALIGSSGNGKSTLLNLLVKFYEPHRGTIIFVNESSEQHVRDIEESSLRERIGYVGQEPILLGRTAREVLIAENIDDKRIWQVLDICCISDLVKDIGLDAPFKTVSGGQKQRLAIARAVLRNPEILILDEGTSALDSINEQRVLKNLKNKSNIGFIIMIAHRTQTLAQVDEIFKIKKGEVEKVKSSELFKEIMEIEGDEKIDENVEEHGQEFEEKLSGKPAEFSDKSSDKVNEEKVKFKWSYFKSLLRINKKYKAHYIVGIISAALLGAIFPSFSVIITKLISITTQIELTFSSEQKQSLVDQSRFISIWLFVCAFLNLFMIIFKEFSFIEIGENLIVVLKRVAFKTALNMEMIEIDKRGKANLVHIINNSTDSARNLVSQTISSFVDVSATLLLGITIALVFCWQITLVALLLIPLCAVAGMIQNKFMTQLGQNSDKIYRKTHEMVLESMINNRTLASLNLQKRYIDAYHAEQDKGLKVAMRNSVFSGMTQGLSQMLIAFVICLICYIGALLAQNFDVRISNIFTAIYAVMFSGVQAGTNIQFIGGISTALLRTAQFFQIVKQNDKELQFGYAPTKANPYHQLQEETDESNGSQKLGGSIVSERAALGNVQFKNVYFRYPHAKEYLFEGLSFNVKPRERVAIVGQSGTGKTTIADLLLNIYKPEQGEVLIDKVNAAFYSKKQVGPRFAIVSQEPALFNRSISDNIQYNLGCSFGEVQEAAKLADAFDFVEEGNFGIGQMDKTTQKVQNDNWQRAVGSKGSMLSGGQKQRVAMARALVRKPVLLVMDEATSALDKETEERVLRNIEGLRSTQIIIAHRLSTIRSCDKIIVLKEGKLAEMGTYGELIQMNGEFARLAKTKKEEKGEQ